MGAEPAMLEPSKEQATGILFPRLCNGMTLAGCGVRVKWGFVKVRVAVYVPVSYLYSCRIKCILFVSPSLNMFIGVRSRNLLGPYCNVSH